MENYGSHHPEDTSVYQQLSTRNTSDPLFRHYQQQHTVGEDKPESSGWRNQEGTLEVNRTHIEEFTHLRHKASPHVKSPRPKEKWMTNEHIEPRNADRHEKNEHELDRTIKGGSGQSGLENAGRWLHWD
ncbi:unnamed protein product [Schistosoma mattheei]|uniref:Uncharacterized protein n=1 Tax=Schistosoma mattheei TaxID=31246 RepID=A0A183P5C4_9TREM|nr:unnamed protein product [Schistosoma mattheei]